MPKTAPPQIPVARSRSCYQLLGRNDQNGLLVQADTLDEKAALFVYLIQRGADFSLDGSQRVNLFGKNTLVADLPRYSKDRLTYGRKRNR